MCAGHSDRPARKVRKKCPTAGERWLLPMRAAHSASAVLILGPVAVGAVCQLAHDYRPPTEREHKVSTDLDNAPTTRLRSVSTLTPRASPASPTAAATVSRALATCDTPSSSPMNIVNISVTPLPTANKASPRKWQGLYALKPWYTRRLTPIVNIAVARRVFTVGGVMSQGMAGVAVALGCGRWRRCSWHCGWPGPIWTARSLARSMTAMGICRQRNRRYGPRILDLFAGLAVWAARQRGPGLHWLSWPVIMVLVAALAVHLPRRWRRPRRAAAQRWPARQRCLFVLFGHRLFPVVFPVVSTQLINGSLITAALRLRAAHRAGGEAPGRAGRRSDQRIDGDCIMTATRITSALGIGCGGRCAPFRLPVTGRWRVSGGCVVVANHSSHADTGCWPRYPPAPSRCSPRRTTGSTCRCAVSWPPYADRRAAGAAVRATTPTPSCWLRPGRAQEAGRTVPRELRLEDDGDVGEFRSRRIAVGA